MTHPPSGPGRPGPYGPPGPYPEPAPVGRPGPPPQQQFDPWGRAPGAFESYAGGSLEGPVSAPAKKKRTGLVVGIVVAVVVLVGGGVTALLLLTGSDGGSSGNSGTAAPAGSSQATAPSSPATVAQAAVDSLNSRSASRYATLVCTPPSQTDIADLQKQWTEATDLHGSVSGAPEITGTTATVEVTVSYNGKTQSTKIPMTQQGQKWCIDES